ncbi:hypothetical protein C8Q74DRAFT_1370281 [Fomes fomentarius]|nr:hypothetical protein C8Q74DRAFT_1370281 [Fomes fomentarius]
MLGHQSLPRHLAQSRYKPQLHLRAFVFTPASLPPPADMSSTKSYPRSCLKRTSVPSTNSPASYYSSPRNSEQYAQALVREPSGSMFDTYTTDPQELVRTPIRGSMYTTDPHDLAGSPSRSSMYTTDPEEHVRVSSRRPMYTTDPQEHVREPSRRSMHATDPHAYVRAPSGREMHDTHTAAGRKSAPSKDAPLTKRQRAILAELADDEPWVPPAPRVRRHDKSKNPVSRMLISLWDGLHVDESYLYQPAKTPKRMTAAMAEARVRAAHRADDF